MNKTQKTTTSKDGTLIAFEQSGQGPAVILVAAALSDRSDTTRLANQLAEHFTVINYDRRGRGKSGNTSPYKIEREIEDIEALIDTTGSSAYLFGSSSGAILSLEATNKLGAKIKKVALYEPPLIIDNSRQPLSGDLTIQIDKLVAAKRGGEAVKLFMTKGMGIPAFGVFMMRFMPGWSKMAGMAHTIPYDLAILNGLQIGKPLPTARWSAVRIPTFIMTGEKSEAFFHNGAGALAKLLPSAEHRIMKGQHHGSVVMAPKSFAKALVDFFNV